MSKWISRKGLITLVIACLCLAAPIWLMARELRSARQCQLAYAASESGKREEACKLFEAYLKSSPDDFQVLLDYTDLRSKVILPNGAHLKKASKALRAATDLQPKNIDAWLSYGQVCNVLGESNAAHTAARQVLRIDESNVEALLALATHQFQVGAYRETLVLLRDFTQRFPEMGCDWRVCLLQLSASQELNDDEVLQAQSTRSLTAVESWDEKTFLQAYSHFLQGENSKAEDSLLELFSGGVESSPVLRSALELSDALNIPTIAAKLVPETSVEAVNGEPIAAVWLARRCWQLGLVETLIGLFDGQEVDPAIRGEVNFLLMAAHLAIGDREAAGNSLADMAEGQVDCSSERWYSLAKATFSTALAATETEIESSPLSNPTEIIEQCESVLEVSPGSPVPHFLQVLAYSRLGEYQVASEFASRLTRQYSFWFQPHHIRTSSYLLAGRMDAAELSSKEMLRWFPNDDNALLTFYLVEAFLLSPQDEERAKFLIELVDQVKAVDGDIRNMDLALIRAKACLSLGEKHEAEQAVAPWGSIDRLDTLLKKSVVARSSAMSSARYVRTLPGLNGSDQQDTPNTDSYTETLRRLNALLESEDYEESKVASLLNQLELASPGQAVLWRLAKARWLLRDASEKNAARVVLLLAPIAKFKGGLADAHILTGIALARLHDEALASEHFVIASQQIPEKATEILRLSLGLRSNAHWCDPVLLVQLWETTASSFRRLSGDEQARSIVDRLILLAEFAESSDDLELAEVVYRRLIGLDPSQHFAHNNLAYLLLRKSMNIEEALELSRTAVNAQPRNEDYLETLAAIEESMKVAAN